MAEDLSLQASDLYSHSPVHYAIFCRDHSSLARLLQNLPTLPPAHDVSSEEDSRIAEAVADSIADVIDRRDVPGGESPLHLAVRVRDAAAVEMLMAAGANWSLQNEQGWSALQEAVCAREEEIAMIISRYYMHMGWIKWSRRMPLVAAALRRIRNFYMEITFNFESSVIPFIGRIAPSDTYRIWKRGSNLRADMTLAGYDGFRAQRSHQSVLLLGDGSEDGKIPPGSVLILFHKDKEVTNATEGGSAPPSEAAEIAHKAAIMSPTNVYRVGIDVTQSELVPQMNWRRHARMEKVGLWKSQVFDMHRLTVSIKSRRVPGAVSDEGSIASEMKRCRYQDDVMTEEERRQLENVFNMEDLDSGDEGFDDGNRRHDIRPAGVKNARGTGENKVNELGFPSTSGRNRSNVAEPVSSGSDRRKVWSAFGKKPVKQDPWKRHPWSSRLRDTLVNRDASSKAARNFEEGARDGSADGSVSARKENERAVKRDGSSNDSASKLSSNSGNFEREYKKRLWPMLWLTPDYPIKTEELLPLLDILANRVKAVWRLRELLTTKLPTGLFPVKVAIPVFPTIRMVVTFGKFQELPPTEDPCAPASSVHFQGSEMQNLGKPDSSGITGPRASTGGAAFHNDFAEEQFDPFAIPSDYTWVEMKEKRRRMRENNARSSRDRSSSSRSSCDRSCSSKSPESSNQNGKL